MLIYRCINTFIMPFTSFLDHFIFLKELRNTAFHLFSAGSVTVIMLYGSISEVFHCGVILSSQVNTVDDLSSLYILHRFIHFMWLYIFISLLKNHFVYLYSSSLLENIYL